MWTRTIVFVFGLAVCVIAGCAPAGFRFPHWNETANTTTVNTPAASSSPAHAATPNPAPLTLIREQDKQEENLFAPISPRASDSQPPPADKIPERPERLAAQTKVSDESASILQNAPGPQADDRLLELLQKDLDRAIEQPPERRRLQFSKATTENPKVRYYIGYFSRSARGHFQNALARSGKYVPMITRVLREEGLPDELAYLALIESGFVMDTASPSGAAGIWQLVPGTARRYGLRIDLWIDERRDPIKSTRAAAAYLKDLHKYFGRWYLATAAYNAGQRTIDKAMQASGAKGFWKLSEQAELREETRNFVPKFIAAAVIAADPKKYGFANVAYEAPVEYEEVEVSQSLKLEVLAPMAETDLKTLQELNPALLKGQIPPGDKIFRVKVPVGRATLVTTAFNQKKESQPSEWITHKVAKGETLFSIARRYGQNVKALMELNGLTTHNLKIGQQLKILVETVRGVIR